MIYRISSAFRPCGLIRGGLFLRSESGQRTEQFGVLFSFFSFFHLSFFLLIVNVRKNFSGIVFLFLHSFFFFSAC